MFEEISKSIKAELYERVSSPLFGAFSFSWMLWNWKFLLVLISGMKAVEKIKYIDGTLYHGWFQPIFFLFLAPLISAAIFIYLYPIPAKYVFRYTKEEQKKLLLYERAEKKRISLEKRKRVEAARIAAIELKAKNRGVKIDVGFCDGRT